MESSEPAPQIPQRSKWFKYVRNPGHLLRRANIINDAPSFHPFSMIDASLASSKGPRGHDLLRIQFPYNWDGRRGDVFDWYNSQSSTHFASVQYRKEYQEPFCHEFLILKLANGDICRMERMGDPVQRTAALARTGTTSHDVAQVFPPSHLNKLGGASYIVAEIEYPHEVDLLDVLAICYGIQRDAEARQYTLQRYNCYFFVWTILACLARHVAPWPGLFTSTAWHETTQVAIDQLTQTYSSHDTAAKSHDLTFRVSRLLAEGDPAASQFLLDALRDSLNTDETRWQVCNALASPLWPASARVAVLDALHPTVDSASHATQRHEHVGRRILETVCSEHVVREARNILDIQELQLVWDQWNLEKHREWRLQAKNAIQEYKDEHRVGGLRKIVRELELAGCTLTGVISGVSGSFPPCITEGPTSVKRFRAEWDRVHPGDRTTRRQQLTSTVCLYWFMFRFVFRVVSSYARTTAIGHQVKYMNTYTETGFPFAPDWIDMTDTALSRTLDVSRRYGPGGPDFVMASILRVLDGALDLTVPRSMNDENLKRTCRQWDWTWRGWVWYSVGDILADVVINRLIELEPKTIKIMTPEGVSGGCFVSYTQFHDDLILPRLEHHSSRIGRHQLGSSSRIVRDVKNAMFRIWVATPKAS